MQWINPDSCSIRNDNSSDEESNGNQARVIVVNADVHRANSQVSSVCEVQLQPLPKTPAEGSRAKTGAERMREFQKRQQERRFDKDSEKINNIDEYVSESDVSMNGEDDDDDDDANYAHVPLPYSNFHFFRRAHRYFEDKCINNPFGYACSVCDRLWFEQDLKPAGNKYETILKTIVPDIPNKDIMLSNTCRTSLTKDKIPIMATYNGFKYPAMPSNLPALNLVEE